jgi:hypothetical protein
MAALVTVFALPAYAQDAAATPAATPAAATGPCTEVEAKAALYGKFRENFNKGAEQQKVAYESSKEYLSKYGSCTDPADVTIIKYVQNWVNKYEEATLVFNCQKAANETPAQAFDVCKAWIAARPDDLRPHLALVGAGIKAYTDKNNSLNARAAAEARTVLQMIESGKTTDTWAPFANQQDTPAGLRYYIAAWSLESNPEESATQLLKIAQSNSAIAKEPGTFQLLGVSVYNGDVKKMADQYKTQCEGKDATHECDVLLNKINYALDRVIDAYARTIALANANPSKYGATVTALRPVLATLYKQRHEGQETGLNEMIAGILNKPLPLPGQEPPLPTPPATTGAANGTSGAATPAAGQPAGAIAKPASTTTTTTTPAAKPAATPKPPRS